MMTFDSRMKERKGCAAVGKGGGGKSQPGLCCTIGRVCIYGIYTSDVTKDEIRARPPSSSISTSSPSLSI